MGRIMRTAAIATLALLASACAVAMQPKMRISADRNPGADFASYRTYAWATAPEGGGQWPARDDRTAFDWDVRKLVDQQMAQLGYQQTGYGADLLIDYGIDRREKTMDDSYGSYAAYLAQGGRGTLGETWVGGYQEGTLIVEASDPRRRTVVWYGAASAVVNPSLRAQRLPQAISQIFASFPARTAP